MKTKAIKQIQNALELLARARNEGALTTLEPGDGPIYWAAAVGGATANLQIALREMGVGAPDMPAITRRRGKAAPGGPS